MASHLVENGLPVVAGGEGAGHVDGDETDGVCG